MLPMPEMPDGISKTVWGSPAGKKRLAKKLAAMIPGGHSTYVEAFAGSGAVFFATEKVDTEVLNDMDPEIAFAFKAIQSLTEAEKKKLSKKNWTGNLKFFKGMCKSTPTDKLSRLHKFLYTSAFSYGLLRGSSFNHNKDGVEVKTMKRIEKHQERLKGVKVFSTDYRKVVKKFDSKNTFLFLDPPYVGTNALNRVSRETGSQGTGEKDFDEDAFYDVLKTIKGKFLVTYGTASKTDWPGFNVKRIKTPRTLASMRGVKGPKFLTQLLISNYDISKADIQKALGPDVEVEPVVKGFPNGQAEGGVHVHALERENSTTKLDGKHTHLFELPDGTTVPTNEDGQHRHPIFTYDDGPMHIGHDGEHVHIVKLPDGTEVRTEVGGFHSHDSQVESTAFDGTHDHKLVLPDGSVITSLTATDFWRRSGEPSQAGNPDAPPASQLAGVAKGDIVGSLRDFTLRAPFLSLSDGNLFIQTESIRKAVESALAQMLPPEIARKVMVIEGEPTGDYVEAADLSVTVREKMIAKHAVAKTEKRIEVNDDGEYCVIAETSGRNFGCFPTRAEAEDRLDQIEQFKSAVPDVLTMDAVAAGRMPQDGESGLSAVLERQVPSRFQYWKAEGDEARATRDAFVDSGLDIRMVAGQPTRVVTTMKVFEPGNSEDPLAKPKGFVQQLARVLKGEAQGVLWTLPTFPRAKLDKDQVMVFDGDVVDSWIDGGSETLDSLVRKVAELEHDWMLPLRDSVGARAALSRVSSPFVIEKSATAGWVFASSVEVAKARVEFVDVESFDSRRREFTLSRQVWKSGKQSVWHLLIDRPGDGLDSWVLQGDPVEKSCVGITKLLDGKSMLDFEGGAGEGSEMWIEDRGTLAIVEESDGVRKMRIDGDRLRGEFALRGRGDDSIWKFDHVSVREPEPEPEPASKSYQVQLVKTEKADEERFVYGIVLEPEVRDAQDDIYSSEEIREAAHKFMSEFQNIGVQHSKLAKQVDILESFLAPAAFTEAGKAIKKGTWMLAVRIKDTQLWKAIKRGEFTGFSIGGSAVRRPAEA